MCLLGFISATDIVMIPVVFVTLPLLSPGVVKHIVMSLFVCQSVGITQKPHGRTSPNFCACCLWPWISPPVVALQCVMYFQFCGYIIHIMAVWHCMCSPKW